jgi:hypothetical protein
MKGRARKHLKLGIFSWILWGVALILLVAGSTIFILLRTPINEDALKTVLKEEMFSELQIKKLTLSQKTFNWRTLAWDFELSAEIEKIWGIDIKVKNLNLQGSKALFSLAEVKKATLKFAEDDKAFRGGIEILKNHEGIYVWDLSNLDFRLGMLRKKIGDSASLSFDKTTSTDKSDAKIKATFIYNSLKIPLDITLRSKAMVVQIPKTLVVTKKQSLPFDLLEDIPTSGEWTLASRIELKEDSYSEASLLQVKNALVALSNVQSSFIRNGRGVGVLSVDVSSSENLINGKIDFDLAKATFESANGNFFKAENIPFLLSAEVVQNRAKVELAMKQSKLSAEIERDGTYVANLNDFELSLIPDERRVLNSYHSGHMSGKLTGSIKNGLLNQKIVEVDSINANRAKLIFENFSIPGLQIEGPIGFEGEISQNFENRKSRYDGEVNFKDAQVSFAPFYKKNFGTKSTLIAKLKGEKQASEWKNYSLSTFIKEQPIEISGDSLQIKIEIPKTLALDGAGLISGSLNYPLCENRICDASNPYKFQLKFADFNSDFPLLQGLKVSGKAKKNAEKYEFDSFSLTWPQGDRAVVNGTLEKFKDGDLSVNGNFDFKNIATANPFLFFKEMPLEKTKMRMSFNLKQEDQLWTFLADARFDKRKMFLEKLSINQNAKTNYKGSAELNLEPYLLRNEASLLTSTLRNEGNLNAFEGLLMRGKYAASLVIGTSGLNLGEFISHLKLRASGEAIVERLPAVALIGEGLDSYSKEKQKASAKKLAQCYPKKMRGKFDFDYDQGRWNLAPSAFQGLDRDSIVKLQGSLGDLTNVNLVASYLPGPKCDTALATCLGDAFPKGGMTFEVTGAFKDPETDLDFAFIDQSLERCREIEARIESRTVAESQVDTRDQKTRIKELRDFYNSRKLSP